MFYLILFFLELLVLFFLSKALSRRLSRSVHRITGSVRASVSALAILFLPGTFLHEISHAIVATALFVKVRKFSLIPEIEDESSVQMGHIQIEEPDLIRSLLIGVAPLILGIAVIFLSLTHINSLLLNGYIVFEVGNTMFSSRKDLEGGLKLLIVVASVLILMHLLGVTLSFGLNLSPNQVSALMQADKFLAVPVILDFIAVALLGLLI